MRAVVQRVSEAAVRVDGAEIGRIGPGLLVLLGVRKGDGADDATWMADRVAGLRIFQDEAGKMNRSLGETGGGALVVSQFTLVADARQGRRPSFIDACPPDQALVLYERFCEALRGLGVAVQTGRFGADMKVSLVNDGPVTLVIDDRRKGDEPRG